MPFQRYPLQRMDPSNAIFHYLERLLLILLSWAAYFLPADLVGETVSFISTSSSLKQNRKWKLSIISHGSKISGV